MKYPLANSLSSAGTSSASSVSSAPSNISGIANDAERNMQMTPSGIPTTISLTNGVIETGKYSLMNGAARKSNVAEISDPKHPRDSGDSSVANSGIEILAVQQIYCYESDLVNLDRISSSSCDTRQNVDSLDCFDNSYDNDTDNVSNSSYITTKNSESVNNDSDGDSHKINSVVLSDNMIATTATAIPTSESMLDSVALNHVITLDGDVISLEDDDDNDEIRILKL